MPALGTFKITEKIFLVPLTCTTHVMHVKELNHAVTL